MYLVRLFDGLIVNSVRYLETLFCVFVVCNVDNEVISFKIGTVDVVGIVFLFIIIDDTL
jgi:uncharacterized membrane protein